MYPIGLFDRCTRKIARCGAPKNEIARLLTLRPDTEEPIAEGIASDYRAMTVHRTPERRAKRSRVRLATSMTADAGRLFLKLAFQFDTAQTQALAPVLSHLLLLRPVATYGLLDYSQIRLDLEARGSSPKPLVDQLRINSARRPGPTEFRRKLQRELIPIERLFG